LAELNQHRDMCVACINISKFSLSAVGSRPYHVCIDAYSRMTHTVECDRVCTIHTLFVGVTTSYLA
jgi:hypothetical protein